MKHLESLKIMLSSGLLRRLAGIRPIRYLTSTRSLISYQKNTAIIAPTSVFNRCFCDSKSKETYEEMTHNVPKYQLQPIDKFFLVVTGTMKHGEIPDEVSYEIVEKSQNRRRIMINVLTMIFTLFGSAYAISQGKRARDYKTEDSVFERNIKRYEKLREKDGLKEAAAKAEFGK